jgi:translation initiation factor IF-2
MTEEGTQVLRLKKAATEFNIGVSKIIDFLAKKGHKIDPNPNTKITSEQYDLLVKEFQSEKTAKEEANKVGLNVAKRETLTIEDKIADHKETPKEQDQSELLIKTQQVVAPVTKIAEKPPVKETAKPKVLGTIDLDTIDPKAKKAKAAKEAAKSKDEKAEEETKVLKTKKSKAKDAKAAEEEKIVDIEESKPSKKKKKTEEEIIEEKPKEAKKKAEAAVEKKEEPAFIEVTPVEEADKPDFLETEVDFESNIKVIGKIDLSSLNTKTKPPKKTKLEKENERKAKKLEKSPKKSESTDDTPEEDVDENTPPEIIKKELFKTGKVTLEGPTILGKMDLPPEKDLTKKPVASSSEDPNSKKKKRKRIKKERRASGVEDQPGVKTDQPKSLIKEDKTLRKGKYFRPEVDGEEIQKQIKETLARLSGAGKSKASKHRRHKREMVSQQMQEELEKIEGEKKVIKVTEFVTANELATMMHAGVTEIISTCLNLGIFVSINQRLDAETLAIVADEFGYTVEFVSVEVQEAIREEEDNPEDMTTRSPIVTVMGHVDHGKTSLLDNIRNTNVIAGEAGGITQHIGAYEVKLDNGKSITFLDTPGHEAFTAMRARGAQVTDIAIIVIAADDNVMPQTIEAINHAQAAGCPIVFAINKIDKPNANPEKIREELSKMNILVEEWGGKYQCQEIAAKKGINVELLLDKVLLEAEMLDLKGNAKKKAQGTVIESSLDKGRGYVSTILVQNGTLHVGDILLAGCHYGRVKALYNERGNVVTEAGPSAPVLVLGLNGASQAGDKFNVMDDEKEVKSIAAKRLQLQREQGIRTQKHITLDEIGRRIAIGDFKELNIIVKGDVDGSIEALTDSLLKLSNSEVQVNVIHKSVGQVTESDVLLASASNAIIIGFQVRPSVSARKLAEHEQIDIRLYSVIYNAINEIKSAIEGMLSPEIEEKIVCNIEIREVFKITKVGTVAGCMVIDGRMNRNTRIRLIRDGIVIYTGELGSLKRFKDDVKEVSAGYECGLNITNYNDINVGDIIEAYEETEIKRKL